ncbi:MAG: hypothetical protein ACXWBL_15715 [Usitatibacter sp.]
MSAHRAAFFALAACLAGCAVAPPAARDAAPASAPATKPAQAAAPAPAAPSAAPVAPIAQAGKPAPPRHAPKEPAATRAPAAPPPATRAPAALPPAASAPPLDLTSLEEKLKETPAIGVMTKLSLRNQVNDLLDQFRAYYAGRLKTSLADLRRPYELLLMKVLSLLQDADPALARAINASREAIWGILSDPQKFSKFA